MTTTNEQLPESLIIRATEIKRLYAGKLEVVEVRDLDRALTGLAYCMAALEARTQGEKITKTHAHLLLDVLRMLGYKTPDKEV